MANGPTLSPSIQETLKQLELSLVLASETKNFVDQADEVSLPSWPEFMMHDEVANKLWFRMNRVHADFQFALVEKKSDRWVAVGNSIPVYWDQALTDLPDTGWDWALSTGMGSNKSSNLLCALAIQILPDYRGRALSSLMVNIMKQLGVNAGLHKLIAPIRPNRKSDYPLLDMDTYLSWKKGAERFDPWLRVHERLGAQFLKVCPEAMVIKGSVSEWESWTGLSFQSSGEYIIPGALKPVKIDIEKDFGVYVEPNVWFIHASTPDAHN